MHTPVQHDFTRGMTEPGSLGWNALDPNVLMLGDIDMIVGARR